MTVAIAIITAWLAANAATVGLAHRAVVCRRHDIRRLTPDLLTCQAIWQASEQTQ